tara:strand:+ start:7864 stop:8076 length:213 start_codon:yes stop_codon:yes gene_type:complete
MIFKFFFAKAFDHCLTDSALYFFGFSPHHRSLISNSDGFEVNVRVKSIGVSSIEFVEKLITITPVYNKLA